jgi:serine/threonine protein kinase
MAWSSATGTANQGTAIVLLTLSGGVNISFRFRPGDGIELGRSRNVTLPVDDRFASRRHCRIDRTPDGLVVTDLGSANGTYLNGQPIESTLLRSGDLLEVGSVELRVRLERTVSDDRCAGCNAPQRATPAQALPLTCQRCLDPAEHRIPDVELVPRLAEEGYEVLDRLGGNGAISVFRARSLRFGRPVVVKALPLRGAVTREQISRFAAGARAQALLRHRNVAVVHDVRRCRDLILLVMEEVEGETLRGKLARGDERLSLHESLRLGYQLARALAHLQSASVVHRDLRPANVIVTPEGDAKLIGFGSAKQRNGSGELGQTALGDSLGLPGYAAPEQALIAPFVDTRADLYSLGAILQHCLTGERPRPLPRAGSLLPQKTLGALREVPRDVATLVLRLTQQRPEDRPASPETVLRAIETITGRLAGAPADASNTEVLLRLGEQEEALLLTPPGPFRRQPEAAFRGRIQGEELIEFFQLLEFHRKSGTLNVSGERSSDAGVVLVREGQVLEASCGAERSSPALRKILDLRQGSFSFSPHLVPAPHRDRPTVKIGRVLLEHLRASDESRCD